MMEEKQEILSSTSTPHERAATMEQYGSPPLHETEPDKLELLDSVSHSEGHKSEKALEQRIITLCGDNHLIKTETIMEKFMDTLFLSEESHEGRLIMLRVLKKVSQAKLLKAFLRKGGLNVINSWLIDEKNPIEDALFEYTLLFLERLPISERGSPELRNSGLLKTLESISNTKDENVALQARQILESWQSVDSEEETEIEEGSPPSPIDSPPSPIDSPLDFPVESKNGILEISTEETQSRKRPLVVSFPSAAARSIKKLKKNDNKPKKSVQWQPEELIMVVKTFLKEDIVPEPSVTVPIVHKGLKSALKQDMIAEADWHIPVDIKLEKEPIQRGTKSEEKKIQEERTKSIIAVFYVNEETTPISPAEPSDEPPPNPSHIVPNIPAEAAPILPHVMPAIPNINAVSSILSNPVLSGLVPPVQPVYNNTRNMGNVNPMGGYNNNMNSMNNINNMGGMGGMVRTHQPWKEKTKHCVFFGSPTGCIKGDGCPFIHDPEVKGSGSLKERVFDKNGQKIYVPPPDHLRQQMQNSYRPQNNAPYNNNGQSNYGQQHQMNRGPPPRQPYGQPPVMNNMYRPPPNTHNMYGSNNNDPGQPPRYNINNYHNSAHNNPNNARRDRRY